MIYFDELSVAQQMETAITPVEEYKKSDVLLYAKYLRYKKIIESGKSYDSVTIDEMAEMDSQIEKDLIGFCETYYTDYNYIVRFEDIDSAIAYSRSYKLKLPLPLPITRQEWDAISALDNDNYRRMIFVMLVDAKYNRLHSIYVGKNPTITEDTLFYCRMNKRDIYKAGKCKFKDAEEKDFSLGCLYNAGLFDITENKYCSWFVKFVDMSDGDIIDYITDYDHLDLHYDRLMGTKIGTCELCGKLFKQGKTKTARYCYKHRGYNKIKIKKLVCIDCGKEFEVGSKSRKKERCNECQKLKHLKDMRDWKKNNKLIVSL